MRTNKTLSSHELKTISLIITVVGLIILIHATKSYMPEELQIKDIDAHMEGQYVLICDKIQKLNTHTTNTFMTLGSDTATINTIFFKEIKNINYDKPICITGTITFYKNTLEIIGDTIKNQQ